MLRSFLAILTLSGCIAINDYGIFESPGSDGGLDGDVVMRDGDIVMRDGGPDGGRCTTEELCNASDDDCDGAIDEGCPIFVGRPSPLVLSELVTVSPHLSSDGLRLYYVGLTVGRVWVTSRSTIGAPFQPSVQPLNADMSRYFASDVTLSSDELEIFMGAIGADSVGYDVFTATRDSLDTPFDVLSPVDGASGALTQAHAGLSRDGTELFFDQEVIDGSYRILRLERDGPRQSFGSAEMVELPFYEMYDLVPRPSLDGLTLYFSRATDLGFQRPVSARRASRDSFVFDAPMDVEGVHELGTSTSYVFVSERTGEVFFASTRPWSTGGNGIWRARICHDGPCIEEIIECDLGMTSPDGRHCYWIENQPSPDSATAAITCAASGGHLATVHSTAEHELLQSLAAMTVARTLWLGGSDAANEGVFEWSTGEPFVYTRWQVGNPNDLGDEDCVVDNIAANGWEDCSCTACASTPYPVCETELTVW